MKINRGKRADANNMSIYIYRHNFLRFGVWGKVNPPEKGFFGGEIKQNGACFFKGGRNEITQFLKSVSNNMSIYRRNLETADFNNMSIMIPWVQIEENRRL